ncbi:MAG: hypothetical protein LEGION0398_MBIBDBAK_00397 [Legionellaceae bacterium]
MLVNTMSLGEIVTPNIKNALSAVEEMIKQHNENITKEEVTKKTHLLLKELMPLINDFKQGKIEEDSFDSKFIETFKNQTQIELSIEQLNAIWNSINPTYDKYKIALEQAIEFNKTGNKLIFITYSNQKDINFFKNQLMQNHIEYKVKKVTEVTEVTEEQGNSIEVLTEIDGIEIFSTHTQKTNKANLLEEIFNDLRNRYPNTDLHLVHIQSERKTDIAELDNDDKLVRNSVENKCSQLNIEVLHWDRSESNFKTILNTTASKRSTKESTEESTTQRFSM